MSGRSVAEDHKKCSVEFGVMWKYDAFSTIEQTVNLCSALSSQPESEVLVVCE